MRGSCGGFLSSLRQASCRTNHGPGACRCPFQTLAQRRHSERDGPPFADARVWYVASRNFGRRGCCAGSSTEEATVALPPSPTWLRRGTTEGNRGQQRATEDNRGQQRTTEALHRQTIGMPKSKADPRGGDRKRSLKRAENKLIGFGKRGPRVQYSGGQWSYTIQG
jgi:hypothetical protein